MLPLEGLITVTGLWQQANDNVLVEVERPHEDDPAPELVIHLQVQRKGRVGIDLQTGVSHFYGQSIVVDGLEQSGSRIDGPQDLISLLGRLRDSLI